MSRFYVFYVVVMSIWTFFLGQKTRANLHSLRVLWSADAHFVHKNVLEYVISKLKNPEIFGEGA